MDAVLGRHPAFFNILPIAEGEMVMQDNLLDSMPDDQFAKKILEDGCRIDVKSFVVVRQGEGPLNLVLKSGNNTQDLTEDRHGCFYRLDSSTAAELARELHQKTKGRVVEFGTKYGNIKIRLDTEESIQKSVVSWLQKHGLLDELRMG